MEWQELLNKFEELGKLFGRELEIMPYSVQKKMMSKKFGIVGPRKPTEELSLVVPIRFEGKEVVEDTTSMGRPRNERRFNTPISIGLNHMYIWIHKAGETDLPNPKSSPEEIKRRFIFLTKASAFIGRPIPRNSSELEERLSTLSSPGSFGYVGPNQTYTLELSHVEHTLLRALEDLIQAVRDFFEKAKQRASYREWARWNAVINRSILTRIEMICEKSRGTVGPSPTLRDIRLLATNSHCGPERSQNDFIRLLDSISELSFTSPPVSKEE